MTDTSSFVQRNGSLMRAHAALKQLAELKTDSLLHPIDMDGPVPRPRRTPSHTPPLTKKEALDQLDGHISPGLHIEEEEHHRHQKGLIGRPAETKPAGGMNGGNALRVPSNPSPPQQRNVADMLLDNNDGELEEISGAGSSASTPVSPVVARYPTAGSVKNKPTAVKKSSPIEIQPQTQQEIPFHKQEKKTLEDRGVGDFQVSAGEEAPAKNEKTIETSPQGTQTEDSSTVFDPSMYAGLVDDNTQKVKTPATRTNKKLIAMMDASLVGPAAAAGGAGVSPKPSFNKKAGKPQMFSGNNVSDIASPVQRQEHARKRAMSATAASSARKSAITGQQSPAAATATNHHASSIHHETLREEEAKARAMLSNPARESVLNKMLSEIVTLKSQQQKTNDELTRLNEEASRLDRIQKPVSSKSAVKSHNDFMSKREQQPSATQKPSSQKHHSDASATTTTGVAASSRQHYPAAAAGTRRPSPSMVVGRKQPSATQRNGAVDAREESTAISPAAAVVLPTGHAAAIKAASASPSRSPHRPVRTTAASRLQQQASRKTATAAAAAGTGTGGSNNTSPSRQGRVPVLSTSRPPSVTPSNRATRTSADAKRLASGQSNSRSASARLRATQQKSSSSPQKRTIHQNDKSNSNSPSRKKVTDFSYSRNKLREFEKKKQSYLQQQLAHQESTEAGSFLVAGADPHKPRQAAVARAPKTGAALSQQRARSNYPPSVPLDGSPASPYNYYDLLPNRHAPGGGRSATAAKSSQKNLDPTARLFETPTAASKAKEAPPQNAAIHNNKQQQQDFLSPSSAKKIENAMNNHYDTNKSFEDPNISPLSDDQQRGEEGDFEGGYAGNSSSYQRGVNVTFQSSLESAASYIQPNSGPEWSSLPLLPYLLQLRSEENIESVQRELRAKAGKCNIGDYSSCKFWLGVTQLANHPTVLEHVIAPLLSSELRYIEAGDSIEPHSRSSQLLCAIIGLGQCGKCCLPSLVSLLEKNIGDPKLVAMAIRCCGGAEGVKLLTNATASGNPVLVSAAMYGLSLLQTRQRGHTTICCIGCDSMKNQISFYQPEHREVSEDDIKLLNSTANVIVRHQPHYRETMIFFDAATLALRVEQFLNSPLYRPSVPFPNSGLVLSEFLLLVPDVVRQLQDKMNPEAASHVKRMFDEVYPLGGANTPQDGSEAFLDGSYDQLRMDEHTEQSIVVCLMQLLRSPSATVDVKEGAVLSLAGLPAALNSAAVSSFMVYVTTEGLELGEKHPDFLALCVASLGKLAATCPERENSHDIGEISSFLSEALTHASPKVRWAATTGLGEMGQRAAQEAASVLLQGMLSGELVVGSAAWALSQMGTPGIASLVQMLDHESSDLQIKKEAAKSLVACTHTRKDKSHDMQLIDSVCEKLKETSVEMGKKASRGADVDAKKEARERNDVAVMCVESIGHIAATLLKGVPAAHSTAEAVTYYQNERPNPLVNLMERIISQENVALSVKTCACTMLCRFGRAHGEVKVTQTLLESSDPESRLAAAKSLKYLGPKCIRALALGLNDPDEQLQDCVVQAISAIGVDNIETFLKHERPPEHVSQVHSCCADYLQMHHDNGVIRALFVALQQSSDE